MPFRNFKYLFLILLVLVMYGCGGAKESSEHDIEETEEYRKAKNISEEHEANGMMILNQAKIEQQNEMYSKERDSTYLYWLNNALLILNNHSKCNIYALNTIFKAGFKCPDVNVITHDLMDTARLNDYFPYISIESPEEIIKGDLVVWHGHVIIFERLVRLNEKLYAQAWWAGTRQLDNGDNIINNVVYGKYPLEGYYIIRRPIRH